MTPASGLMPDQVPPIPPDGFLLHIGLPKTGTTSVQSALQVRQAQLLEHGVTYPRTTDSALRAGRSLLDVGWEKAASPAQKRRTWERFVGEVQPLPGRVVVSAEILCQSTSEQAARIVNDLGASRIHVVITIRRLADLLPSSWQQYLKTGLGITYQDWLRAVLAEPPSPSVTRSFWRRNDVPTLLGRWADIVGLDRMTVIVSDTAARDRLALTFERLLDLPSRLLADVSEPTRSNRSMTAAEAELLRQVNGQAKSRLSSSDYVRLVNLGAARHMVEVRHPEAGEDRLSLPPWTAERVAALAESHVAAVRASGVTVVGDLEDLLRPPETKDQPVPETVPIEAAAAMTAGALLKAASKHDRGTRTTRRSQHKPSLGERTKDLLPTDLRRRLSRWRHRRG